MKKAHEDVLYSVLLLVGTTALGTLLGLLVVGSISGGFFDQAVDKSASDQLHEIASIVTDSFSSLSYNVSAEFQLSCNLAGIECAQRISGLTIVIITMAAIAWLSLLGILLLKCFYPAQRAITMRIHKTFGVYVGDQDERAHFEVTSSSAGTRVAKRSRSLASKKGRVRGVLREQEDRCPL